MGRQPQGDPLRYYFRDLFLIGQEKTTRLYLVRHAQSQSNTGEASYLTDAPLTPAGQEQARRVGERLARQGIDAIYSSPLRRALETAQAIADATGLTLRVLKDLREVGLGDIGDLAKTTQEKAQAVKDRILREGSWDAFPGSEGSQVVRRRVAAVFSQVVAECPGMRVAAVSHGGVIQSYVSHVLGLERDFIFYPFNTGITSIRALDDRRAVWRLNDIAHLDGLTPGSGQIS